MDEQDPPGRDVEPANFINVPEVLLAVNLEHLPVQRIIVSSVIVADSPRTAGEDFGHVAALAESEADLPPILVHRPTMRIIDGVHRVRAAKLRGEEHIAARFFDGDEAACLVLAVAANAKHGLPLTLADKKSAATRILALYPQWSDRAIAAATGLHHNTVGAIRACSPDDISQVNTRIGRDGRSRADDIAERRELARKFITSNPEASLRVIAGNAGISPVTAGRIRAQLVGEGAIAPVHRGAETGQGDGGASGPAEAERSRGQAEIGPVALVPDQVPAWEMLRADPALKSKQEGRALLQLLSAVSALEKHHQMILETIPAYSLGKVAEAARQCASAWLAFARQADQRNQACEDAQISEWAS